MIQQLRYGLFQLRKDDLSNEQIETIANEYKAKAERDRPKLDQMMLYGESPLCRWPFLHDYFDEPFAENCGHCDNCNHPLDQQLQTRSAEPSDILPQPSEKTRREAEPV